MKAGMTRHISTVAVSLVLASSITTAKAETLRFGDVSGDWYYTDEAYGSNKNGDPMLMNKNGNFVNTPPLYFFCSKKDNAFTMLFQPNSSPNWTIDEGKPAYRYVLEIDWNQRGRESNTVEVIAPVVNGKAVRIEIPYSGMGRIANARYGFGFKVGGEQVAYYPASGSAFHTFIERCMHNNKGSAPLKAPPSPPQG
jgi:hypothetical protein